LKSEQYSTSCDLSSSLYVLSRVAEKKQTWGRGDMGKRKLKAENTNQKAGTPISDRSLALELSASLANENRLGFAQSFSAAVAAAYWRTIHTDREATRLPPSLRRVGVGLSADAQSAALRIAAGFATLAPEATAYAIGTLYTALLPKAFRARHGIFYTPPALVECLLAMAEEAGVDWKTGRVLDPACGGGAFLVGAAARMVRALDGAEPAIVLQSIAARLQGFDIDPFGAWLAQAMLTIALKPVADVAGRDVPNVVKVRDSLEDRENEVARYDLVVGNPPYGRITLAPAERTRFARSLFGHANLYGVFTDAALRWVKRGGLIGYVTPTSMLSGLYFKALRTLLAAEAPPLAVNFISERDGVFTDVLQETMLATYRKGGERITGKVGLIDIAQNNSILRRKIGSFALPEAPQSPWLLPRSRTETALTKQLRSMPHRLRDYGYGVSTGPLVWNRHKEQFRDRATADTYPVIWAEAVTSDGRFTWRSEKRNHAPWFEATRPMDDCLIITQPCVLVQRTTAKKQARRLIAAELPISFIRRHQAVVIENHLNMVRTIKPTASVPATVIAVLLRSATVDAAFCCINGSVAVSAFELEELPLPPPEVMVKLARLIAKKAPKPRIEAAIAASYNRARAV
jgi:adenine-specific DNA-methyltransferase